MTEKRKVLIKDSCVTHSCKNEQEVSKPVANIDSDGNTTISIKTSRINDDPLFADDYSLQKQIASGIKIDQEVLFANQSKFQQLSNFN